MDVKVQAMVDGVKREAEIADEAELMRVYRAVRELLETEDVVAYANEGYGSCENEEIVRRIRANAQEIAKDYYAPLFGNEDHWFILLEKAVEWWLDDNREA